MTDAVRWTMRALIRTDAGVALVERAAPVPAPGEVAIDVAIAGVCRTDVAVADGTLAVERGRILGHELAGRLATSGEPVTVIPFAACGRCSNCARRDRCSDLRWLGVHVDGAFCDRICVPATCVVPLPDGMSLALGAYVEPVAAALGALSAIARGDRVLVEGSGRIAELCARVISAYGCEVTRANGPLETELCERANRFDVVVETSGTCDLDELVAMLRPGGTLILKSRARRIVELATDRVVANELTIRGASHGSFTVAIDWLHARRVVVDDLLAPPQPLAAFRDVLDAARSSEANKQLFVLDGRSSAIREGRA